MSGRAGLGHAAALLGVLLLAAILRFGALGWGLPRHDLGQDEVVTLGRVTIDPDRSTPGAPLYNWPNLSVYLSRLALSVIRAVEGALGRPPSDPVLVGRGLTAVLGCLGIYLLYLAGRRLFDLRVGLLAAAFLAVTPLHAFRSRLWVPDVPMTSFYILALLAAALILERPRAMRFVLAGVAVGLATATKYNGVGAALPVVVAATLAAVRGRSAGRVAVLRCAAGLGLAAAVSLAAYFLADPTALTRLDSVIRGAGWVGELYRDEPSIGLVGWHLARYAAVALVARGPEGVGPVVLSLAIVGGAILLWRRSAPGVMVWLPATLYLLLWSATLRTAYERSFIPLLPHLALAAAVAAEAVGRRVEAGIRGARPRARVVGWIGVFLVAVAVPLPVSHAWAARRGDTRVEALEWMIAEIPAGATILREWDMILPPRGLFDANKEPVRLFDLASHPRQLADRYDYVIASSATWRWVWRQRARPGFEARAAVYDRLFTSRRFELAARFAPGLDASGSEIRIYRSRPGRGPRMSETKESMKLRRGVWANTTRLRKERGSGSFHLLRRGDLVAGRVVLKEEGRYRIEASAEAAEPVSVILSLGGRREAVEVEGSLRIGLSARLPRGQIWWRIERRSNRPPRGPGPAVVSALTLVRLDPPISKQ